MPNFTFFSSSITNLLEGILLLLTNTSSSSTTILTSLIFLLASTLILLLLTIKFGVLMINTPNKQRSPVPIPVPVVDVSAADPVVLPPKPLTWPIVGSLPLLYLNKPGFRWIHECMKNMNTEILYIPVANVHVIAVTSPELAREFLKKQDSIFIQRPKTMATQHLSNGFLTVAVTPWGDQWKKMRRVVTSEIITQSRLKWLHQKRVEEADNTVYYISNKCMMNNNNKSNDNEVTIDLRLVVRQYSGNVIRKLMFNKRYFGEGNNNGGPGFEEIEHVDSLFTILTLLFSFCLSDYFPFLRWLDLDGQEKIVKKAMRIINKYHDPIIDERIRKWRSTSSSSSSDNNIKNNKEPHEPEDYLDVLLSLKDTNGKPLLSPEEIKGQTLELFLATIDNPANVVEWAMAEMINQPELIRKAVEEIDNVVGKDRWVQESDCSKLNYVKACAREAFRLHPVAPFNLPHVSIADTVVGGYFIPKGSHLLLSRMGLGRNPRVWDEPLKFKPERHLVMNGESAENLELNDPDLKFISFSIGRRGCMGIPLGTSMIVVLLGRLLQGFKWSVPYGESKIDLSESRTDLFLSKPLHARAELRLPINMYPTI